MIDQKVINLIQAGVDGELDDAGRTELERVLEASEEARQCHAELRRVAEFLDGAEPAEPPGDLHARIVDGITLPGARASRSLFGFARFPASVRYGLAAAAGVVLTLVMVGQRGPGYDPKGLDDMTGTIAPRAADSAAPALGEHRFEVPGARGGLLLRRQGDDFALELTFDADTPLDFRIDLAGGGLAFDAVARASAAPASLEWADGSMSVSGQGRQRLVLRTRPATSPADASPGVVELTLSRGGRVIHTGELRTDDLLQR